MQGGGRRGGGTIKLCNSLKTEKFKLPRKFNVRPRVYSSLQVSSQFSGFIPFSKFFSSLFEFIFSISDPALSPSSIKSLLFLVQSLFSSSISLF